MDEPLVKRLTHYADDVFLKAVEDVLEDELRAEQYRRDADAIIGKYYMRRGRNKKLTFRQHLKESGTTLSEGYMRKMKVAYDKRHRLRS